MVDRKQEKNKNNKIKRDVGIIIISIFMAIILVRFGVISALLERLAWFGGFNTFIAGLFFSSIFTTAPALIALAEIAKDSNSILQVALTGALGAVCGDLIIYHFFGDAMMSDFATLMSIETRRRWRHIFHLRLFRWFFTFLGGIVIATPFLPDELGLLMMGTTRLRFSIFLPISYFFNFLGILIILLIALHFKFI